MGALMSGTLLDTTVLIDLSRGNLDAAEFIDTATNSQTPLFVSVISAMELIVGCRNKGEIAKAQKLIARFTLLHLSPADTAKAFDLIVTYSKSHGLMIPDALIAATALTHNLELATDNDRHFTMLSSLMVKHPY